MPDNSANYSLPELRDCIFTTPGDRDTTNNLTEIGTEGTYSVTVTYGPGCVQSYSFYLGPVGINEIREPLTFTLTPNPANTSITLRLLSTMKVSNISLYNILGALLNTETMDTESATLDISALQAGIYYITVSNSLGTSVKRLMVE